VKESRNACLFLPLSPDSCSGIYRISPFPFLGSGAPRLVKKIFFSPYEMFRDLLFSSFPFFFFFFFLWAYPSARGLACSLFFIGLSFVLRIRGNLLFFFSPPPVLCTAGRTGDGTMSVRDVQPILLRPFPSLNKIVRSRISSFPLPFFPLFFFPVPQKSGRYRIGDGIRGVLFPLLFFLQAPVLENTFFFFPSFSFFRLSNQVGGSDITANENRFGPSSPFGVPLPHRSFFFSPDERRRASKVSPSLLSLIRYIFPSSFFFFLSGSR